MRIFLIITTLLIVTLGCKKKPKEMNSGMAGKHTWTGIHILHDSTGNDTSAIGPFEQSFTVFSGTVVGIDGTSANSIRYNGLATVELIATDKANHTMTYGGSYGYTGYSSISNTYTSYSDTVIYNYENGSMEWHEHAWNSNIFIQHASPYTSIMHSP